MTHRDAKFHERLARRGLAGNAGMGTELEQQAPEAWEAELAAHFAAQADSDKLLVSKAAELTMGAHFRGTTLVAVRRRARRPAVRAAPAGRRAERPRSDALRVRGRHGTSVGRLRGEGEGGVPRWYRAFRNIFLSYHYQLPSAGTSPHDKPFPQQNIF